MYLMCVIRVQEVGLELDRPGQTHCHSAKQYGLNAIILYICVLMFTLYCRCAYIWHKLIVCASKVTGHVPSSLMLTLCVLVHQQGLETTTWNVNMK